ncbi:MAG: DNA-directed RNA polymerase subunit omega [Acidobacteriota bacterium]
MDHIPQQVDSKFRYILLASARAEQIMKGARPKVDDPSDKKATAIAIEEMHGDRVPWSLGPGADKEPAASHNADPDPALI